MSVHPHTTRLVLIWLAVVLWLPVGNAAAKTTRAPSVHALAPGAAGQGAASQSFSGKGFIDRVGDKVIIINDCGHLLASPGLASDFQTGQYVGFNLNANGEIVDIQPLDAPAKK